MKHAKQILSVEFNRIHALLNNEKIDWTKRQADRLDWVKRLMEVTDALAVLTLNKGRA